LPTRHLFLSAFLFYITSKYPPGFLPGFSSTTADGCDKRKRPFSLSKRRPIYIPILASILPHRLTSISTAFLLYINRYKNNISQPGREKRRRRVKN
jgi:hypothetical protein